ncbi:MAG: hypothetical protein AAB449_00470 [Patescibacteria group bacterium]
MAFALLLTAVAFHFIAVVTGVYDIQINQGFVWFDNVLHVIVGVAFGLWWFRILRTWRPNVSRTVTIASLFAFVLFLAISWEVSEYIFFQIFDSFALGLKVYSPSLQEAFFDAASDMVGVFILVGVLIVRKWFPATTQ